MEYVYPPRPKSRMHPTENELGKYEATGKWIVQPKFNGSRNLIHITPEGKVIFWNRHREHPKTLPVTTSLVSQVLSLNIEKGKEYWLDGEAMTKTTTPETKNKIILYDVLMAGGKYLFNSPNQMGRLELLADICRHPTQLEPWRELAYVVTPDIWMTPTWDKDFFNHFQKAMDIPDIEGLVFRRKDSVLGTFGTTEAKAEVGWQIRCRKPHKNYNL